jgi:ribosomal-protein-alanine N-acetyltransferase
MNEIISINNENMFLINDFINNAGDSLINFRYFSERNLDVVKNHLHTCVILSNNNTIAYGHLDYEDENIWLGVAVAQNFRGNGLGKKIVMHLIKYASDNNLNKIKLSVDTSNNKAINLYKSLGFNFLERNDEKCFMLKNL